MEGQLYCKGGADCINSGNEATVEMTNYFCDNGFCSKACKDVNGYYPKLLKAMQKEKEDTN